jgi:hypothetical protein
MEKTWKPTAAGVVSIIAGIIGLGALIVMVLGSAFLQFILQIASEPYQEIPALTSFTGGIVVVGLIIAALAIVGGIYALRRRIWGLALAGSICALVPFVIPGILAIVFLSQSKNEFQSGAMTAEERIAGCSEAILLNPSDADAYFNRGCAYGEAGEYEETIADFSKAIVLRPDDADAYYARGCAYAEKGEVDKAVSDLERCIELSTDREVTKAAQQELNRYKGGEE